MYEPLEAAVMGAAHERHREPPEGGGDPPRPAPRRLRRCLDGPYRFDFLGIGDDANEIELEGALVQHITPARFAKEFAETAFGPSIFDTISDRNFSENVVTFPRSLAPRHGASGDPATTLTQGGQV